MRGTVVAALSVSPHHQDVSVNVGMEFNSRLTRKHAVMVRIVGFLLLFFWNVFILARIEFSCVHMGGFLIRSESPILVFALAASVLEACVLQESFACVLHESIVPR